MTEIIAYWKGKSDWIFVQFERYFVSKIYDSYFHKMIVYKNLEKNKFEPFEKKSAQYKQKMVKRQQDGRH
jgi:hypothetical protein